ncbi:MAG: ROK family protein, partial [Spirochaetaceae bacterium]|nr:ROK family protein [Spirochaetaceae bacterium]
MEKFILGIDIGGTKCAVILGNEDRAVIEKRILETDHGVSASAMIERIIDTADEVILNHPDKAIIAVGISCGGPLDSRTG